MTATRTFSPAMRKSLHRVYAGLCADCGAEVGVSGEADHLIPFAKGGLTEPGNAQLLCSRCNKSKGTKPGRHTIFEVSKPELKASLRPWQRECLAQQLQAIENGGSRFFVAAGVGSGKTVQALSLYLSGPFDLVVIVTPRSGIRGSWTKDAKALGIDLKSVVDSSDFVGDARRKIPHGFVLNAGMVNSVSNDLQILCSRFRVLAIFDEAHHLGEGMSWAASVADSLTMARFSIGLSGTPFRTDDKEILLLDYQPEGATLVGTPTYQRSYEDGVAAGEVAPVVSRFIGGSITKRRADSNRVEVYDYADGDYSVLTGGLKPDYQLMGTRLRLSAVESYEWQIAAIAEARKSLIDARKLGVRFGGLIACATIEQSKKIGDLIRSEFGDKVIVLVGDANTEDFVDLFNADDSYDWIVSITKVAEGINIDRLIVGVILTTTTTRSMFEQLRGRIVRLVGGVKQTDQTATLYLPADPRLIGYAVESNRLVMHRIRFPEEDTPGDQVFTQPEAAESQVSIDGVALGTGNLTADDLRELHRRMSEVEERRIISTGNYVLIAEPRMEGGAIGEQLFSESEYDAIRTRLCKVVHPMTVARLSDEQTAYLVSLLDGGDDE